MHATYVATATEVVENITIKINIVIKTQMLAEKQYYQTESGHESYMHYYLRNILRRFGFQSHSFNLCGELIFNSTFILLLNITITTIIFIFWYDAIT
jgi:hypothetical protein